MGYRVPDQGVPIWVILALCWVAAIGALDAVLTLPDRSSCADLGRASSVETKYSMISGCYVQVDGRWIPVSAWRVVP